MMPTVYWYAVACLAVLVALVALRVWLIPPTRGEHANYDAHFSVLAMAARIIRESRNRDGD